MYTEQRHRAKTSLGAAKAQRFAHRRAHSFTGDEFRLKEEPKFGEDILPIWIGVRKVDLIKGHWSHLYPQKELEVGDTGPGPGDYNPNPDASAAYKRILTATIWPEKKSPLK